MRRAVDVGTVLNTTCHIMCLVFNYLWHINVSAKPITGERKASATIKFQLFTRHGSAFPHSSQCLNLHSFPSSFQFKCIRTKKLWLRSQWISPLLLQNMNTVTVWGYIYVIYRIVQKSIAAFCSLFFAAVVGGGEWAENYAIVEKRFVDFLFVLIIFFICKLYCVHRNVMVLSRPRSVGGSNEFLITARLADEDWLAVDWN